MPFRKRYRGRRRRRYRRRYGRSKSMWKNYIFTQKKQLSERKFIEEERGGASAFTTTIDSVHWQCVQCVGSPVDDNAYALGSKANQGQQGVHLGDVDGMDNDQKDDNAENTVQKYLIYKEKLVAHYKNMSLIPAFLTAYEVICKKLVVDSSGTYTDCRHKIMDDFLSGIQDYMGAGSTSTTTKVGDNVVSFTGGSTTGTTYSKFISPTQSRKFNIYWKVKRKKMFKLNPGDEVFWTLKSKNHIYDPMIHNADNGASSTDKTLARPWLTKALIIKCHGAIIASTGTVTEMGLGIVNMAVDTIRTAKVLPLKYGERNLSHYVTHEVAATLASAVAPGRHDDKNDA